MLPKLLGTETEERLLLPELLALTAFLAWLSELLKIAADLVLLRPEEFLELTEERLAAGVLVTFLLDTFDDER